MIELTPENYYSLETDWEYMSFSQFKNFKECEAKELARLKGEWEPAKKKSTGADPLILGNYVHSYFESIVAHEAFVEANKKELISSRGATKGKLKSSYQLAEEMIKTLDNDKLFDFIYTPGKKEVIVTGQINDHAWKGKIDSLVLAKGYFCDLKTVDDIHKKHWDPANRIWTNFIEDRGYIMQAAIYQELIKQTFGKQCQPYLFAVSKQTPPDKGAFDFQGDTKFLMQEAIDEIKKNQDRYWQIMNGEVAPKHCGKCEYCRLTKELSGFQYVTDIEVD